MRTCAIQLYLELNLVILLRSPDALRCGFGCQEDVPFSYAKLGQQSGCLEIWNG